MRLVSVLSKLVLSAAVLATLTAGAPPARADFWGDGADWVKARLPKRPAPSVSRLGVEDLRTYAVVSIQNDTTSRLAYQLRYSPDQAWSDTKFLDAGKATRQWGWGGRSPEIRFDASGLDGWQTRSYGLTPQIQTVGDENTGRFPDPTVPGTRYRFAQTPNVTYRNGQAYANFDLYKR